MGRKILIFFFAVWFFVFMVGQSIAVEKPAASPELLSKYAYYACMSDKDDKDACKKDAESIAGFINEHQKLFLEAYASNNCSDDKKKLKEGFFKECMKKSLQDTEATLSKKYSDYDKKKTDMRVVSCINQQNIPVDAQPDTYDDKADDCRKAVESEGKEGSGFIGGLISVVGLLAFIAAPVIPVAVLGSPAITATGGSVVAAGITEGGIILGAQFAGSTLAGAGSYIMSDSSDIKEFPEDADKVRWSFFLRCISEGGDTGKCNDQVKNLSRLLTLQLNRPVYNDCIKENKDKINETAKAGNKTENIKIAQGCEDIALKKDITLDRKTVAENVRYLAYVNRNMDKLRASANDEELLKTVKELKEQSAADANFTTRKPTAEEIDLSKKISSRKFKGISTISQRACKEGSMAIGETREYIISTNIADRLVEWTCTETEKKHFLGAVSTKEKSFSVSFHNFPFLK